MKELERLEEKKFNLVNERVKYQDVVDSYNEKIYKVCSEIEIINIKIKTVKEQEAKRKKKAKTNGVVTLK